MCGIVGVVGTIQNATKDAKLFRDLLTIDVVRGKDSTGVVKVDSTGNVETFKLAVTAGLFLDMKQANKTIDAGFARLFIGHNRAATIGGVSHENAHPFQFGTLTGVHNGTLTRYVDLDSLAATDSAQLYEHMSKHGLQDTLNKIEGAYALAWHDSDGNTFNLLRNDERPMHYAFTKDGKGMVYASEWGMLIWMADRYGIEFESFEELPIHTHLKMELPASQQTIKYSMVERKKEEKVVPLRQPANQDYKHTPHMGTTKSQISGAHVEDIYTRGEQIEFSLEYVTINKYRQKIAVGYTEDEFMADVRVYLQQAPELEECVNNGIIYTGMISKEPSGGSLYVSPHSVAELVMSREFPDDPSVYDFGDASLSYTDFQQQLDKGCAWCSFSPPFAEASQPGGIVVLQDNNTFVCKDCAEMEEVSQYLTN